MAQPIGSQVTRVPYQAVSNQRQTVNYGGRVYSSRTAFVRYFIGVHGPLDTNEISAVLASIGTSLHPGGICRIRKAVMDDRANRQTA